MSEPMALGATDAQARWIGVRRHQAVLIASGMGLAGDAVTRTSSLVEALLGLALVVLAIPLRDGQTGGDLAVVVIGFLARSRWTSIRTLASGGGVVLRVKGEVSMRGYELQHRGRLDLSGRDLDIADALASLSDSLAIDGRARHVSVHVQSSECGVATLLALPIDATAPDGWRPHNELIDTVVGTRFGSEALWVLERWGHVRTGHGVARVLRVVDFSAVAPGRGLLERAQHSSVPVDFALHADIVGGERAQRIAARAVHRVGSDDATSTAFGFRRTARHARGFERLRQREALVASGRSLLRVGVYVVVRAATLGELQTRVDTAYEGLRRAGLRCERGFGHQAAWYRFQLPGGPGW